MIRFKYALPIILIGISLVACTHTYHVKLYDPLTYGESRFAPRDVQEGKPIGAEKIRVVIKGLQTADQIRNGWEIWFNMEWPARYYLTRTLRCQTCLQTI